MARLLRIVVALGALTAAAAAAAHEPPRPRAIQVSGEAEIEVVPDRATVALGVEAREKNLADAEGRVTELSGQFLKLCAELGIPRAKVRSAQLTVFPDYESGGVISARPRIVGYFASRSLDVDLEDLSKLGRLLQGAAELGVNRMHGPVFGSSRKDEHERAALAAASADAKANAQAVAQAMGVKLGPLRSLSAAGGGGGPMPMVMSMRAKAAEAMAAEQTYEPGQMKFTASVSAEFDLAP